MTLGSYYTEGSKHLNEDPSELPPWASEAYLDRERLGQFLTERVLECASGTGTRVGDEYVTADLPSDKLFAGTLAPSEKANNSGMSDKMAEKLIPSALQATFRLPDVRVNKLSVKLSGHVYCRVFPSREQQFDSAHVSVSEDSDEQSPGGRSETELIKVYRRIEFESDPITIDPPSKGQISARSIVPGNINEKITDELVDELERRVYEIDEDPDEPTVWRDGRSIVEPSTIDLSDLPGAPADATLDYDDYSGNYQLPPGLLTVKDEGEQRKVLNTVVDRIVDRAGGPFVPPWDVAVDCEFTEDDEGVRGELTVENSSKPNPGDLDNDHPDYRKGVDVYDTTLFDVESTIRVDGGEFSDFTFERLEEDFRYDRYLPGHGTNCTVTRIDSKTLETSYLPTYRQGKYETRDPNSFDPSLDTTFKTLTDVRGGGLEALENIAERMWEYESQRYDDCLREYKLQGDFRESDQEAFAEDRESFKDEIRRFERGIKCLRWDTTKGDGHIVDAFEAMNQTFIEKVTNDDGTMEYDSWRLFQLVFILRVLPDIASREYDEWSDVPWREETDAENFSGEPMEALDLVDILWFPTGGGKTEAYLGLAIFTAFFDRKRGKRYGVSAWTRFPLRLLSLQQTQRITELLTNAEMIRLQDSDINGPGYLPFSLGYLVGSKNTPNKVSNYAKYGDDDAYLAEFHKYSGGEENDDNREEIKVIPSCPACGADVRIRATDDLRIAHVCTNDASDCKYQQRPRESGDYQIFARDELPVHIVDNELYRYAPTMIVGTIDKITAVGYERKSAHVYAGKMTHWCPEHGFASFDECTEKYGCHENYGGDKPKNGSHLVPLSETPFGEPYDVAPGLQIQDELHLLEESLGTFDSHFETFTDALQRYNDEQRTKIIGATATIEEYDDQARELYLRKAERFPAQGPKLGENFYATTQESTRRQFAGVMPHGETHINAVIMLNFYYLREFERFRKYVEDADNPVPEIHELGFTTVKTNDDLLDLLDVYQTCLTYTISKRDKNRYRNSMDGQIAGYLRELGLPEPRIEELTGDTPFDEVETILDGLENPPANPTDRTNVIAATNMISHGVDIDRFNFMVFFGMPRQTAEYIQSSSRAGRRYPGSIVMCFNPARERDQSHYHLFEKYHEFLDRLVEPVPINRWSHFSVERTLPSMIFGWILNQWLYESGERLFFGDKVSNLMRALAAGNGRSQNLSIDDKKDFQRLLRRSYGTDLWGDLPEAFEERLNRRGDGALSQLENIQSDFASNALNPGPMTSLRDIDEPVPFKPHDDANRRLFNAMRNW